MARPQQLLFGRNRTDADSAEECHDETLSEVESWPDTEDIGLTPHGRKRLEKLLDQYPDS